MAESMIPKIVHQVCFGGKPSDQIAEWMEIVRKFHPSWQIIIWHENDIGQLGLDFGQLKFKCVNWASLSNIVRLHALYDFGGIYLDLDCEILKPLDPLLENDAFAARQDSDRLCNAVAGSVANHRFIKWQIDRQERLENEDAASAIYLMSEAPRDGVTIVPTELFYPFLWDTPIDERMAHPDSFMLHHWKGSWKK